MLCKLPCIELSPENLCCIMFLPLFSLHRDSFPFDQQFNILMRFIVDQTQTPNLKVGMKSLFTKASNMVVLACHIRHTVKHRTHDKN